MWTEADCVGTRVAAGSGATEQATLDQSLPDGTYPWRVRAKGNGEPCDSDWGEYGEQAGGCPFTIGYVSCATTIFPDGHHIAADTEWNATGSPYVFSGTVTVDAGVTLTMIPGTVVKGAG